MMKRMAMLVAAIGLIGSALSAAPAGPASARPRAALNAVLPQMSFDGIAFADALDFLRDVSGANIHVNWKALEAAGVSKDAPVNLRLRAVSLRTILSLLLSEAGAGDTLTFEVDRGVIEVTTRELADQKLYVRAYPVDDLIMEIPDFAGPSLRLDPDSAGSGDSGGGESLFENTDSKDEEKKTTRGERAQNLIDMIQETVRPDIWEEGKASIRFFNGSLIVNAPRSVHEAIGGVWE